MFASNTAYLHKKPVAMFSNMKLKDLGKHEAAIVASIAKYPMKKSPGLATVLLRDYGSNVGDTTLQR